VTTALYRRYRPDAFADVVGQEHVTEPLMQALRSDRVAHAYLFSGPRGCGKTTSARILARCLNCEKGPTDTPCGACDSCVELARGGSGSVDVVEIDAASHNGVDDARDLRERAAFAPARDRYKIFILDEAHMVTTQGFNALLKLVEEPPPHVRFIFATTEPDKVIGTIRSRTHHYPFRLVPPGVLTAYLQQLCDAEGVSVASGVLPLVVRAGGGSVRDSLSVLDQLMAGSDAAGVTYERAISLLGFTDATLLDDAVDAIAAADGASLFSVVSRVIETGHEPRRFVEDLLERLRDVLILATAGDAGAKALGAVPQDQVERMRDQARNLGLERASRAADLVNDALTSMVGATSPRLHLELLCARLVAADSRAASRPTVTSATATPSAPVVAVPPVAPAAKPTRATSGATASTESEPAPPAVAEATPAPDVVRAPTGDVASGAEDAELVRRRWAEVLGSLERRRVTWAMVSQSAQVAGLDGGVLRLAFDNGALAARFAAGEHPENVALAVRETLGLHVRVEAVAGPGAETGSIATRHPSTASLPVVSEPPANPRAHLTAVPDPEPDPSPEAADDTHDIDPDDEPAPSAELTGAEAVAKLLGGTVVEE
jgi:DNA polymerase-3 subunit gamma/tau